MADEGVDTIDATRTLAVVGLLGAGGYLILRLIKKAPQPQEKEITSVRYE